LLALTSSIIVLNWKNKPQIRMKIKKTTLNIKSPMSTRPTTEVGGPYKILPLSRLLGNEDVFSFSMVCTKTRNTQRVLMLLVILGVT
jgi:hypothetical protein